MMMINRVKIKMVMKIGRMMMALMSKVVENDKAVEIRNQKVEKR